jgi:outer membrane protein TolC
MISQEVPYPGKRGLRRDIAAREAELSALLGHAFAGRPEQIEAEPLRVTLNQALERARTAAPMLLREEKMIQRAELSTSLARREIYPDFTVSAGAYSMGSMGQMYMARLDFTLPIWAGRKQRAAIAEQVASERQARGNYQSAARTLEARVSEEYAAAQTALRLLEIYRDTVIPQSNLALESSLASYETGAVDLLTVLSNFGTTLEYEMNVIDERTNYLLAVARIGEMTGIEVTR